MRKKWVILGIFALALIGYGASLRVLASPLVQAREHQFLLSYPNQIRGDQLVDEIERETGIDIGELYSFTPPQTLNVYQPLTTEQVAQIADVVSAHVPDPFYFEGEMTRARAGNVANQARARALIPDGQQNMTDLIEYLRDLEARVVELEYQLNYR